MKPAPFDYFAPGTAEEALALLDEHGDAAKPLAGGQSLIPAMNFRLARPQVLVDLNRAADLSYIRSEKAGLAVGAMTRQRAIERSDLVARVAPLLAEAMPWIAHPQIRNRGTVGGSLAHADPSAELPAVALALEARFRARSAAGERSIAVADFFKGMLETALQPGELLVEVTLPALAPRTGTAFLEVARRHGDYALVGVAVVVTLDAKGRCQAARIACLSVVEAGWPVPRFDGRQLIFKALDFLRQSCVGFSLYGADPNLRLAEQILRGLGFLLRARYPLNASPDLHEAAAWLVAQGTARTNGLSPDAEQLVAAARRIEQA